MSKYKKQLPQPSTGVVWTYFVSRDSIHGELLGACDLWNAKPLRTRIGARVTWLANDAEPGSHLGRFRPDEVDAWFHTFPETDLELIRIEQNATQKMLDAQAQQAGK